MGDQESVLRTIDDFLSEVQRERAELERVLATILFTDIVGSTEKAAELGDAVWRQLLEHHHAAELGDAVWRQLLEHHHAKVRALLERFRGHEVNTAGDGFFATFDGPARAIRCALAIVENIRTLGIEVRAGLHRGECELIDGEIGGLAIHIGARIASQARPSEVLVSQTVKDLVVGSALSFEERGDHKLKGVPGTWRLHALSSTASRMT